MKTINARELKVGDVYIIPATHRQSEQKYKVTAIEPPEPTKDFPKGLVVKGLAVPVEQKEAYPKKPFIFGGGVDLEIE